MTKIVPARLLGGLIFAATAFASPVPSFAANDEPAQLSEDVGDEEIMPPNGGNDERADRESQSEERSDAASPSSEEAPSAPPTPDRGNRVDREAAKRALLSDPKPEKPNPLLDSRGPDYYDRRAKELLEADNDKVRVALHPLMEANPDSYVVVCTGGCANGEGAQIVSIRPKPAAAPAPAAPAEAGNDLISCVGGCGPDGPKSLASRPESKAVAATVGEWMTTVAKVPAGTETPAPNPAGSGDWMEKINRERDSAKAAAAQQGPAKAEPVAPAVAKSAGAEVKPAAPGEAKPSIAEAKPAVETKPAAIEARPVIAEARPSAEMKPAPVESKPSVAVAKPVTEPKPAVPVDTKPIVAEAKPAVETKPAAPVEAKPVVAEARPSVETKPAPTETKPSVAVAKPVTEPKPAAPVETKPVIAEVKPSIATKPAAPAATEAKPVTASPASPVQAKPIVAESKPAIEAKPAAPLEAKTAIAEAKPAVAAAPASPTPQKMATLETPKADPAPAPVKPSAPEQPAAIAKPDVKAPASAPIAAEKPADAKPAAPQETKVAALEQPVVAKPAPVAPSAPKERVISVLSEDKEMNAAIEKARGSLAAFWKSFEQPGAGEADHALKVAIPGNGTTEHFWLTRIKRDGGKLSGVISNQPQSVKTVKIGQRYEFTNDMISDWTFKRNGKLVGNETMRVLLPRMPEEQASVYRQMYETP